MKQINVLPIEDFLNKARIARKSNQQVMTLTSREYIDLYDSLASVMTRLTGILDQSGSQETVVVKMDGGNF
jgi:hypothetical protein